MTDENHLKFLCEKLAYVCFLEDKGKQLAQQKVDRNDIESFSVRVFIEQYVNHEDADKTDLEMTMRFTVALTEGRSVTFVYYHDVFMPAILDQVIKLPENLGSKIYSFDYGKPNPIVLHDAEFMLEDELGVMVE